MSFKPKVYVTKRPSKNGRAREKLPDGSEHRFTYHLKWCDEATGKWKSKKLLDQDGEEIGDRKRADAEALKLEEALSKGTYSHQRDVTWREFVAEHVESIAQGSHQTIAKRTLDEFGEMFDHPRPRRITGSMLKGYVGKLRAKGNKPATINKKMRYVRMALNAAVDDGFIHKNPMTAASKANRWRWEPEPERDIRQVSEAEEAALLPKAEELAGVRFRAFLYVALNTGARCGELLGVTWDEIDLGDEAEIKFTRTKGKRIRRVPLNPEVVHELHRVQVQTQHESGPFTSWRYDHVEGMFRAAAKLAEVNGVTLHDLRRTFITRLIRKGAPPTIVKRLAGHKTFLTTERYYNAIHKDAELRGTVALLRNVSAG